MCIGIIFQKKQNHFIYNCVLGSVVLEKIMPSKQIVDTKNDKNVCIGFKNEKQTIGFFLCEILFHKTLLWHFFSQTNCFLEKLDNSAFCVFELLIIELKQNSISNRFIFRVRVMVLNATFNNISVILWTSVLFVEETRVPGENQWLVASHWQTLSRNVVSSTPRLSGVRTHNTSGDRHLLQR